MTDTTQGKPTLPEFLESGFDMQAMEPFTAEERFALSEAVHRFNSKVTDKELDAIGELIREARITHLLIENVIQGLMDMGLKNRKLVFRLNTDGEKFVRALIDKGKK